MNFRKLNIFRRLSQLEAENLVLKSKITALTEELEKIKNKKATISERTLKEDKPLSMTQIINEYLGDEQ